MIVASRINKQCSIKLISFIFLERNQEYVDLYNIIKYYNKRKELHNSMATYRTARVYL